MRPLATASDCDTANMARTLRIAVSVFFGLLTVVLCVLWVRSYWWWETMRFRPISNSRIASVGWVKGSLGMGVRYFDPNRERGDGWLNYHSVPASRYQVDEDYVVYQWGRQVSPNWSLSIRPWWPALGALAGAVAVWFPRTFRFSIRTLLIAMTLVAVVLGLAVWAGR